MRIFVLGVDETTLAFLKAKGFSVTADEIETPEELHEFIDFGAYDAVVADLDTTLWGMFAVRYLRSKGVLTPFVGITIGDEETSWSEQRSLFLENGGDDFLRSPVNPRELAATLRSLARRGKGLIIDIREFQNGEALVRVNLSLQTVTVNGTYVHFTGKELIVLSILASNRGRTLSKEMILTGMYTALEDEAEIKIVDVFICKIRRKLSEVHPDAGEVVETVWGRGYQMRGIINEPEMKVA
ncbi:MAG: response regulator transcription factor [Candidatus Paceibacterota bacterium]